MYSNGSSPSILATTCALLMLFSDLRGVDILFHILFHDGELSRAVFLVRTSYTKDEVIGPPY
jgi:hypothetical protein